jgi:hypothetical protein
MKNESLREMISERETEYRSQSVSTEFQLYNETTQRWETTPLTDDIKAGGYIIDSIMPYDTNGNYRIRLHKPEVK